MSEWKEYKLGEISKRIMSGGTPRSGVAAYYDGKIPWLNTKEVNFNRIVCTERCITELGLDNSSAKWIPCGSVIVAMYGATAGKVAYSKIDLTTNQACCNIVVDEKWADSEYVYYYLMSSYDGLSNLACGAAQQNLSVSVISDFPIVLPLLGEQKRIAGVLSSLDDKIDLLNRENATLEALAETIFRHYFIENPDPTWKEGKLGDYVYETIGGEWGKEAPEEEYNMPVRCLRGADVADLNDGLAQRTPLRYIKQSKYDKIEPYSGDIILEISGGTDTCSTGRVAFINDSVRQLFDYPIVFSNFCRLLRVKEEHTYFVYCYFRYLHKQGEFFNLENGSSGIHNLNYKAALYDDMGWPVPTDEKLVIEFGEKVKSYFDKINTNKKQILSLSAQRDTLLPRLMSGEVKIYD